MGENEDPKKVAAREYARAWRERNRQHLREYFAKLRQTPEYRESHARRNREYRERKGDALRVVLRDRMREWRENNRERFRENNRRMNEQRSEKRREYNKSVRDTPRVRAREALAYAVRSGKVIKPEHCSECGVREKPKNIHGHHEDYAFPYNVSWLCSPCHGKRHREQKG